MEKTDRRVKRTQRLLQNALISLTLEKGYEDVTIRDITDRADVGYTTFFRHFPDKETLLADVLEAMSTEFQTLLTPHSIISSPERMGTLLFEYVEENVDLCRVLLDSTDTMVLLRPVQESGVQEIKTLFRESAPQSIPLELAADHLITSLVMLIRWWLEHEMPFPPDQMGIYASELIIRPIVRALTPPAASETPTAQQN
jgi:AcrR family transcriptional regulator